MKSHIASFLLLAGCAGPLGESTFNDAYFILTNNEMRFGSGALLLSDTELACGELTTTTDWNATLYGANALFITLTYSYSENPLGDPWVTTFGSQVSDGKGASFQATASWYTEDGLILRDNSGLLVEIEQYSFKGVSGSYRQIWSSGSFDAEHCGMVGSDNRDTGP